MSKSCWQGDERAMEGRRVSPVQFGGPKMLGSTRGEGRPPLPVAKDPEAFYPSCEHASVLDTWFPELDAKGD